MFKIPTFSQSTGMTTARKAEGAVTEAQRVGKEQAAQYQKQLAEHMQKLRDLQASQERTQMMTPPAAQDLTPAKPEDQRLRRSSGRGSLLAGNTGGYNPATGAGGRLGGRSLLG